MLSIKHDTAKNLALTLLVSAISLTAAFVFSSPLAQSNNTCCKIEIRNMDRQRADKVCLIETRQKLLLRIKHIFGIGKTDLILKNGVWPDRVQIEFQEFKALEGLKITTGAKHFESSISTTYESKKIDLKDGFTASRKKNSILIDVPQKFCTNEIDRLQIEWIDFYRN